MIFVIKLKKYVAGTRIFGVVIGKLRYSKKPYLIILLEIDKSSKVGFFHTILPLSLAVRLWIEGSKKYPLDAKKMI